MPKKFKGENSKAAAARARKEEQRQVENDKKQKAIEDAYWADDDKHVARKQQRKDDKERKQKEALERKQEKAKLYEEEMSSIKSAKECTQPSKMTRAQISDERQKIEAQEGKEKEKKDIVTEAPLEENANLVEAENEARTVDEAISVLSVNDPKLEKHPEKRVKAAYTAYEEKYLPILKAENPNLRLSQLKQMLKKDWMKSPENPMNQAFASYNTKQ